MNENLIRRNYNMTDAELCSFASSLAGIMTRDIADLAPFGITAATIASFKALVDAFEMFPSDDYMLGDMMIATRRKDQAKEEVKNQIRIMAARFEAKFGRNSGEYKKLGISDLSNMNDKNLLGVSRGVYLSAVKFKTQLADYGVTDAVLEAYNDMDEAFEHAINDQGDAIMNRDNTTQDRIKTGNELYAYVTKYCNFGKTVYERTDPAKYNDYVIYEATPGGLTAPKNLRFFHGSKIFMWDKVTNALSYELEMSLNQIDWTSIFYESWNETEVDVPEGISFYRVRAHNAGGFSDYSDVLPVEYYTILPTPQNFRLELIESSPKKARCLCDVVPTAEIYMTYISVVNIGASPGNWTGAASNVLPDVINDLEVGKRSYFQMQAQNDGQSSGKTEALYIDVVE